MCTEVRKIRPSFKRRVFFLIFGWLAVLVAHVTLRAPWKNGESLMKAWKVSLFLIVPVPVLMFATLALETSPILSCDIWDELDPEEEKRRLAKYYKGCMDHYLSNKVQVWLVTLCCFAAVCILASIIDWVPIQDNRLKIGLIVAESLCVGFAICFFLCPYLVLAFKVERFRCDYDPEYRISNSESELLFSYSEESLLSQELNSSLSSLG